MKEEEEMFHKVVEEYVEKKAAGKEETEEKKKKNCSINEDLGISRTAQATQPSSSSWRKGHYEEMLYNS